MLSTREVSAVMPSHSEQTACHKGLWVDYDLTYSGDSMEGVFDELKRSRDGCRGFLQYEPALLQWQIAKLSFFGGLLGALIGALGSNFPHWFVMVWKWMEKVLGIR